MVRTFEVEHLMGRGDRLVALAAAPDLADQPAADEVDQPGLQDLLDLPQLGVLDRLDAPPGLGPDHPHGPVQAEVAVVQVLHLRGQPAEDVHAVGDVADRHLLLGAVRVEGCHIRRETVPCSALTPLACRESFRASTVMQNGSLGSPGLIRPRPRKSSNDRCRRVADRAEVLLDQIAGGSGRGRRPRGYAW